MLNKFFPFSHESLIIKIVQIIHMAHPNTQRNKYYLYVDKESFDHSLSPCNNVMVVWTFLALSLSLSHSVLLSVRGNGGALSVGTLGLRFSSLKAFSVLVGFGLAHGGKEDPISKNDNTKALN